VAEEAIYHHDCYKKFLKMSTSLKRGRSESDEIRMAMEEIYRVIEETDDCQFTLKDLNSTFIPDRKTIKQQLIEKYGDDLVIASDGNHSAIFCFKGTSRKLLTTFKPRRRTKSYRTHSCRYN